MLEPDSRELLLDLLRPPDGWTLGHALGTTFTLDLQALLLAPLSFAMFDWAVDDSGRANPLAMLEALRRYADRTTLFCQAGMISLPPQYSPLLVHLEQAVVPVTPPNPNAIFHPKIWLLQFVCDNEQPRYRLVSQSRNLTFDRSWDTVVALEGSRRLKRRRSQSLSDFVGDLAVATSHRLDDTREATLHAIAQDLPHVKFDPPEGFDKVDFHGFGLGRGTWPFPTDADRALVISPFLGSSTLDRISQSGRNHVLVSRAESFDEIGANRLTAYPTTMTLSANVLDGTLLEDDRFDQAADQGRDVAGSHDPEAPDASPATDQADASRQGDEVLQGLHAKVFAFEQQRRLSVFTGSANATEAAFGGNVEVLVELVMRGEHATIDHLLEGAEGVTALGDLLTDYAPAAAIEEASEAQQLDSCLELARRRLGALTFRAVATALTEDPYQDYDLHLRADGQLDLPDEVTEVHCWHVSAGQGHQVKPTLRDDGFQAHLGTVSYDGLTSFYALEATAEIGQRRERTRFVVNATLQGAPAGRNEDVLGRLLKDRDDLLRYLLFLLEDSGTEAAALLATISAGPTGGDDTTAPALFGATPLLETLLQALVSDPDKVDQVGRLLRDLERAGRLDDLVPADLAQIWAPIAAVRDRAPEHATSRDREHADG